MRKVKSFLFQMAIYISTLFTIGALIWIIGYILVKGLPALNGEFITGLMPMIVATLYLVGVSLVIAVPIGVFSAIYLTEYAKQGKIVGAIRFATECLSGIPSIIYGLFGMLFFGLTLKWGFSILSGSATLSIMVLPTIVRATEEAIKAVPVTYKEGSLGLGASRLRTIFKIILPTAMPGILAAIILSIGRVVGETAAVMLTAGTNIKIPDTVMDSGRSLAIHLYILAKEGISFEKAFGTATVLIVTVLCINLLSSALIKRVKA